MNTPRCPDKETLFGYVVGTITEDVAEAVAQHLLACRACEQTIEALEGLSDTVVSALRQAAPRDAYAEEPACRQVLQQLQALRVGGPDIDGPLATASSPPQPSRSHSRLGDYELLKTLGQGGMGTVYQAQHVRLKRVVALKVLPQNRLGNTDAVARFEREIEAVGRLDHPHIVRALDAREVDGIRFLVMEHVDGLDLAEVVARCGPLSVADACEVIRQAALGLQCSEEHGLVHRDIKPSNLMLNAEGQIKVLDLGLAQFQEAEPLDSKVTGIGQLMGTPDCIAPEQALESHAVDIRTDIYSLGGTLYYLLAGQPPFSGSQYDTPLKKVAGHLRDAVPPITGVRPDLPKPLIALLERMLAKNASQRVARPSDVVSALAPLCAGSKLIGLLRTARAKGKQAEDEPSHEEAEGLQVCAAVNASRDELAPLQPPDEPAAAVVEFNPYHRWLGIAPAEQPADHYRLLGIPRFESDPEVIRDAATRQMAHVRTYHLGPHSELSQKILNELGMAKACLLDPQKKAVYDAPLRAPRPAEKLETPAPPTPGEELAALVTDPDWRVEESLATERLLPRVASSRLPWWRTPVGMTAVAAGFLTVLLLGVIIRVQTNYGTVKIEIPAGIANVELKLDRETISIEGLDDPLRLRPGAHELVVTGNGYETVCTSFTVRRGNNPPLTVTLVRADVAPPDEPVPVTPPQQLAPEQRVADEKLGPPLTITNSIGMQFVLIPDGEFMMGSPADEEGRRGEEGPQHSVHITRPFYLGMYEVTRGQFRQFVVAKSYRTDAEQDGPGGLGFDASKNWAMARDQPYNWRNPGFLQSDDHPVVIVSWNDAMAFCAWLSDQEGKRYSLPTEAQWEYACRAGTTTKFSNGDDPEKLTLVGNLADAALKAKFTDAPWTGGAVSSSDGYVFTSPVGKFQANPWGLYDMHGNVFEWCADWAGLDYYTNSPVDDPPGPAASQARVFRGGCWSASALSSRAAARFFCSPEGGIYAVGFRVAIVFAEVSQLPRRPVDAPVAPRPPTPPNLPTLEEILAGDPIPRIGPLVAQCRKAVQEQDWELARKSGGLLLAAARRGAPERTMAQVTLLCQGLRRDTPDATVEKYLQGLDAPGAFAADVGPPKTAPPNPVDHDRISKEVQQNYGPEYRKAETDQQKRDFAEGILNAARSTTDPKDPAARFVLLEWVSHLAAEAHDWALGGETIEAQAAEFQGVDVLAEQRQLCDALSSAIKDPLEQRRFARQLLSFANVAVDEDRLELAQQFLGEAKKVAQRAKDKGLTAEVQQTDKLLEMIAAERQLAQAAIHELERDPLNAAANAQVGRFYCLVMGQWNRGLPWLALGSDQRLQDLAVQELGLLVDPTQPPPVALRRKLADDWSAVAAAETDRARGMALDRAYHWYREVLRDVTGPDKNIVSNLLRDMQQTGDLILSAPDDAKQYCGHYYKMIPVNMAWHLASRECAELGGHLARVESLSENRFLCQLVGGPGRWLVDGTDELKEGSWIFSNGEPLTFTNWESGQPDHGPQSNEHCLSFFQPSGVWHDAGCGHRLWFICEWDCRLIRILPRGEPPNRKPPKNAVAFGGHHYALIEQPAVTRHVAQDLCASQGGHLVRIESPEEFGFVKTLAAHSQSPHFWIDGNDEASEGIWVDSESEPLMYRPWGPGQPDNGWECEHVAGLVQGELNDQLCGIRAAFICEWDR